MASTGVDYPVTGYPPTGPPPEKVTHVDAERDPYIDQQRDSVSFTKVDATHRKLKPRHIQLIGIGGTIGTALYVQIGRGLLNGGPASLFMAFTIWYVFCLSQIPLEVYRERAQQDRVAIASGRPVLIHRCILGVHSFWQSH